MATDPNAPDYRYGQISAKTPQELVDMVAKSLYKEHEMPNRAEIPDEVERTLASQLRGTADLIAPFNGSSDVIEGMKSNLTNEHLQILERFRNEVRAGLTMRKEWVAKFEGKLSGLDEAIERLKGGGGANENRNQSTDEPF